MAFTKITPILSLALFLVFLTTITSPKPANAQLLSLNSSTILLINGTAIRTPSVFGPCLGLVCPPLPNVTVDVLLNNSTIATGVTAANGSLRIVINGASANITKPINTSDLRIRATFPVGVTNFLFSAVFIKFFLLPPTTLSFNIALYVLQLLGAIV